MILKLLAFLTAVACFRAGQAHPMHHQTWSNNINNRESPDKTYRPIIIIIIIIIIISSSSSSGGGGGGGSSSSSSSSITLTVTVGLPVVFSCLIL